MRWAAEDRVIKVDSIKNNDMSGTKLFMKNGYIYSAEQVSLQYR